MSVGCIVFSWFADVLVDQLAACENHLVEM